jgi:ribonuclease HI
MHAMQLDKERTLALLYINGASSKNGSRTAAAGYGVYGSSGHGLSRALPAGTTNPRAELHALIAALRVISRSKWDGGWVLGCDSMYVINGVTTYVWRWRRNGWRSEVGKKIKNVDLWQRVVGGVRGLRTQLWMWKVRRNANPANALAKRAAARGL